MGKIYIVEDAREENMPNCPKILVAPLPPLYQIVLKWAKALESALNVMKVMYFKLMVRLAMLSLLEIML